ncbi:MAG TPA: hypothetical protein VGV37_05575 [Aliidongia sp.]|uniref:hypothetical protein n=1 Tax=Aliidongia sp. TaxID=1914230 RepID=UPI002DDD203B|nr:hypothetical protein [Aliidongia sp.]HEV2673992.1 hypothetical protein [Aliidongia sp.]
MISHAKIVRSGFAALALLTLVATAAAAQSEPAAPKPARHCFSLSQWRGGWRSPSPDVIYLNVDMNQIWRIDLSAGSHQLQWPDRHLVSIVRGGDTICSPIDLDLSVADDHGFREPLIAKAITKLTPEQVAALPAKDRP